MYNGFHGDRTWDEARPGHIFGFDPWGTGYKARETVLAAFKEYFANMPDDASGVIKERHRVLREGGLSDEDASKLQSTLSNAYFNTIPTLFWTIHDIYSRPELLKDIRQELSSKAVQRSTDRGNSFVLDIAALQTQCHILLSAFQETQRTRHAQVGMRMVIEDTLLDGKYLLKKGTPLHLPAKSIHRDPSIWGSDASEYDPYRFVPASATGEPKTKPVPTAFLPWGAAPWLCPARQFAATEILIIVALLALRVDLNPVGRVWEKHPATKSISIATLPHPKADMRMRVSDRKEGAGSWSVLLGKSKIRISLSSG